MMKNHDHHVMLQTIIPASIRDLLHLRPRKTLMHLGKTFQKLCTKVLNPTDIQNLRTYVAEILCMLKIWWPPRFFDLQTHSFKLFRLQQRYILQIYQFQIYQNILLLFFSLVNAFT
jgi:hypothetical protein